VSFVFSVALTYLLHSDLTDTAIGRRVRLAYDKEGMWSLRYISLLVTLLLLQARFFLRVSRVTCANAGVYPIIKTH
jgi:hypothetical protein